MTDTPSGKPPAQTPRLLNNWLSIFGVILAASSFFAAVCLITIDFFREFRNPYMGVLTYLVAPAFLALGILFILVGALRERRRMLKLGTAPAYPRIDLNIPYQRRAFIAVAAGTFVFLLMTALGSYQTYQFTESVMFCGKTCHTVMRPEYTAYKESPHARVECVQCHIGPGATWFVKSKLSGVYQVYATVMNTFPRPIPASIENLRPSRETCEQCHWPQKFYGARESELHHYLPDKKNSPWTIRLLLNIGGSDPTYGAVGGIHWHMYIANTTEYISTDRGHQVIPWVRLTDRHGRVTVYQSTGSPLTAGEIAAARPRIMDCIDCHNRPTHIYYAPIHSVDLAIDTGIINPGIPFIKKQAVLTLTKNFSNTEGAIQGIPDTMMTFYQSTYPAFAKANSELLRTSIESVRSIYTRNIFPEMKVNWREYPDNVGHMNFPGCFRCHDGDHVSPDGKTISRDCNVCHTIIGQGPGEKLSRISIQGMEFRHPVDISDAWRQMKCSDCHDGSVVE